MTSRRRHQRLQDSKRRSSTGSGAPLFAIQEVWKVICESRGARAQVQGFPEEFEESAQTPEV